MLLLTTFASASGRGYSFGGVGFVPTGIGLYGRRYSGYMNDNPNPTGWINSGTGYYFYNLPTLGF